MDLESIRDPCNQTIPIEDVRKVLTRLPLPRINPRPLAMARQLLGYLRDKTATNGKLREYPLRLPSIATATLKEILIQVRKTSHRQVLQNRLFHPLQRHRLLRSRTVGQPVVSKPNA